MTAEKIKKEEEAKTKGTKEITFRCKFCGRDKRLDEIMILTRFFPSLVLCRDCEKEMR